MQSGSNIAEILQDYSIDPILRPIAFENPDGSLVTVVVNPTDAAVSFPLTASGESLACTIPAHAIQT